MAESLLAGITQQVLGKIASRALREAAAIYGVENQISQLGETLTAIKAVLLDAEEQPARTHGLQVWLDRLRDVLYDVEDVLDEFECEALRKKMRSGSEGMQKKVCRFFSVSNPLILRAKLGSKVKEIRERLFRISFEKDQLDLHVRSADNDGARLRSREMTYSFVNNIDVVGRNVDKEKLIEMLKRHENDKVLSVIPIVGIAGMGKTTLAKLVYDDDRVKERFQLRKWVCVPEDFDLKKTIERIIQDATRPSLNNLDIEQLQTLLQEIIKDKRYLLVLDDVWIDNRDRWQKLRDLLSKGASGSKIIVTTRTLKIASMMRTNSMHNLNGLSHEDSMVLFKKCAFDENEGEPRLELLEIGNVIVEKSHGVPLLVKTLGSLLYTKREERYWAHIRDSETWELVGSEDDFPQVLKLSYDYLPSHLKSCFATFSLLPRGVRIVDSSLVMLWIALGFISSTGENLALEDVGDEYMRELSNRSLIQEVDEHERGISFRVHDLLHSLATSVAQDDYSIVRCDAIEISQRVRHIMLSSTLLEGILNSNGVPPFLKKPTSKKLRTFKRFGVDDTCGVCLEVNDGVITREFVRTCIAQCCSLRYLELSYGSFEELPSSICNLKQLRHLSLSWNEQLKKIPNTICELQSLLSLHLKGCKNLRELPKNMERLVNLTFLVVATKQNSLQETGIQYLENLHYLGIHDCENLEVLFEGRCRLPRLRNLSIEYCGRPIFVPFGELTALDFLFVNCCKLVLTQENEANFPATLRKLLIGNFEQAMDLLRFLDSKAANLETFGAYDCPSLRALPEWLPNRKRLKLIRLLRCPNLSSMPHGIDFLTTLEELHIEHCGELSERCQPQTGEDWPKIARIPRISFNGKRVQWMD